MYNLNKRALYKLLKSGYAQKIGLHKFGVQTDALLVQVERFLFHLPTMMKNIGYLPYASYDPDYRNPKVTNLPLTNAKRILIDFINEYESEIKQSDFMLAPYID